MFVCGDFGVVVMAVVRFACFVAVGLGLLGGVVLWLAVLVSFMLVVVCLRLLFMYC